MRRLEQDQVVIGAIRRRLPMAQQTWPLLLDGVPLGHFGLVLLPEGVVLFGGEFAMRLHFRVTPSHCDQLPLMLGVGASHVRRGLVGADVARLFQILKVPTMLPDFALQDFGAVHRVDVDSRVLRVLGPSLCFVSTRLREVLFEFVVPLAALLFLSLGFCSC